MEVEYTWSVLFYAIYLEAFLRHIFGGTVITKIFCSREVSELSLGEDGDGCVKDRETFLGCSNASVSELYLELKVVAKLELVVLVRLKLIFEYGFDFSLKKEYFLFRNIFFLTQE